MGNLLIENIPNIINAVNIIVIATGRLSERSINFILKPLNR
jgi:hypothetical protein